ncbi:hypothetical protein JFY74_04380 [Pectobacterium carotovorum]|nr:hypothetical protein JFY74_04380 [Pectobacterium carotovorum]
MIDAALNQSAIQISLCSPKSIKRPWINFEAGASWIRKIPVVPVCHSGLRKHELPIPLAMLQSADIDNKKDLSGMFNELTKVLGATINPDIDYDSIIERSNEFQNKYMYVYVIKDAICNIINICPEMDELFFSGLIQTKVITIKEYQYIDMVRHLEFLSRENLVGYGFNKTIMDKSGTYKGGAIAVTPKYLNEVMDIIR